MKKRKCRMTEQERSQHELAVKVRKMTDTQICECLKEQRDSAGAVARFIDYLNERTGTGNRIGPMVVNRLRDELTRAMDNGGLDL